MIETLGASSEPVPLQRLQDLSKAVNLGLRFGPLGLQRSRQVADHLMQRLDVVRQGSEVQRHARILAHAAPSTELHPANESTRHGLSCYGLSCYCGPPLPLRCAPVNAIDQVRKLG